MNVFELLTVLAVAAAGLVCGRMFGARLGAGGWVVGATVGIGAALMVLLTLRRFAPVEWLPGCREGRCRDGDYRFVEKAAGGRVFACNCGTRFVLVGNRFFELMSDGSKRPYM